MAMKQSPPAIARNANILFAILLLAFTVFLLTQLADQTKYSAGKSLFAQPRFWPAVSLIGMLVFGAGHCVSAAIKQGAGGWSELGIWLRVFEYLAWFMVYVVLVPKLGYLPATLLFSGALTFRQGYRSPKMMLVAALLGLSIVVVFKSLLAVKIPGGAVYEFLPDALRNFMIINF